jgi:hypothetical protein
MILARLLSATPNTDGEEWDLSFRLHLDEIHTTAYQQDPAPYQRGTVLGQRTGLPYPWVPSYGAIWPSYDAMFPAQSGFGLGLDLSTYPALISAYGNTPVNTPQSGTPPQVPLTAATSNTGGSIVPGYYNFRVSINGKRGPVSPLITVVVPPGTSTNSITISGIVWPAGAAPAVTLYMGTSTITLYNAGGPVSPFWTGSSPDAYGNPTTITIAANHTQGVGQPDNIFQEFLIEASNIAIPGVFQDTVTAVSGAAVTLASGGAWATNQWQNGILSLYYRPGAAIAPGLNVSIASSDAVSVTMSYSATPTFAVGDVVVMRLMNAISITASTIGDTNLNLVASSQIGNQIIILSGTGANQSPKTIQSHTSGVGSVLTIQGAWDVTPDLTSVWIITSPTDAYSKNTNVIVNDGTSALFGIVAQLAMTWVPAQSLYVVVSTCDAAGNCYPQRYQPSREIYVPAQNISASPSSPYAVPVVAGVATPDASKGTNLLILTAANTTGSPPAVTVAAPINFSTSIGALTYWDLIIEQDPTTPSGHYTANLDPATYFTNVNSGLATQASPPNTECHAQFKTSASGNSSLAAQPAIDQPIAT